MLDGHMESSRLFDEDRMDNIKGYFFFMRDVAKSEYFIIDWTDTT